MSGPPESLEKYVYEEAQSRSIFKLRYIKYPVHPSYKSQTGIRIVRKTPPIPSAPLPQRQQDNPYVFRPKSYSKKNNLRERQSSPHLIPPPQKFFKSNHFEAIKPLYPNQLDKNYLLTQLSTEASFFLNGVQRNNEKMNDESVWKFPLKIECSARDRTNPQLSQRIEIVSTDNQKLYVPIHQGLLKANTNHAKQEQTLEGVVNPFNSELKNKFSETTEFIRDYKSGYAPIQLQNKSKKDDDKEEGQEDIKKQKTQSASKTHFIKKKQSTLSLTRTCGVSYIKPSESVQQEPFEPLPPLIFQCSTSCHYSSELRSLFLPQIQKLASLSQDKWIPAIWSNEENMRQILLGRPNGRVVWLHGISSLWPLLNEGAFILVFFDKVYAKTQEEVWKQFNSSCFKFGILVKKSTSGRKLFLKSIQPEISDPTQVTSIHSFDHHDEKTNKTVPGQDNVRVEREILRSEEEGAKSIERQREQKKEEELVEEEKRQCKDICQDLQNELRNCRTVTTMSLKFEMYVHEAAWKNSSREGKNLLNAIVHTFEERLQRKSLEFIRDRFRLLNKDQREPILKKALQKIKVGKEISSFDPAAPYVHSQDHSFALKQLMELNNCFEGRSAEVNNGLFPVSEIYRDKEGKQNLSQWQKSLKMPIYYISTRDSFAFDLLEKVTVFYRLGRPFKKIQYFFEPDNVPDNFVQYKKLFPQFQTGIVCYHDFFTEEELQQFEAQTMKTEVNAFKNKFLHMTVQPTIISNRIKRTKFFFGYRYMWTRCQLAEPTSYVGAGVRRDVTEPPKWIKRVENPMVEHGILEEDFLNSFAINVYHDGSEGLAQHFDDAVRFRQPIYTLRLVSDGRLSFGSQFYGFCNGAFIIPLPRGCICVMNENSYAANGVKHCIRPCDMSGKSAAVIMRQMHRQVVKEAAKYDQLIDFPAWLSSLSEDPRAITFAEQKRMESQKILQEQERRKEKKKEKELRMISASDL